MTLEIAGGEPGVFVPSEGDDIGGFGKGTQVFVLLFVNFLVHIETKSLDGLQRLGLHLHGGKVRHIALYVCLHVKKRLPLEGHHEVLPIA